MLKVNVILFSYEEGEKDEPDKMGMLTGSQKKTTSCRGAVTTSVTIVTSRSLLQSHGRCRRRRCRVAVKAASQHARSSQWRQSTPRTGARGWHNSCVTRRSFVRLKIGRVDSVRRTLRRRRRRRALPAEPATLADVNISGKWRETTVHNPQLFLNCDNRTTSA